MMDQWRIVEEYLRRGDFEGCCGAAVVWDGFQEVICADVSLSVFTGGSLPLHWFHVVERKGQRWQLDTGSICASCLHVCRQPGSNPLFVYLIYMFNPIQVLLS